MTAKTSNPFIDPKLADAIRHWNEYSAESAKNALILFEATTPLKDALQISDQVNEVMNHAEWFPVAARLADTAAFADAYKELAEIQIAALSKWYSGYIQFVKTIQQSSERLATPMRNVGSPQQALAAFLEASLTIMKEYQADTSKQVSSISEIQAAYKAWFQKTLQNLSGKSVTSQ